MINELVLELKTLVEDTILDAEKVDKGNKAAGTRVRKMMQEITAKAKDIRKAVLEAKKSE